MFRFGRGFEPTGLQHFLKTQEPPRLKPPKQHADLDLFARMLKVFADTPWLHYGLWLEGETPSFPG